MLYRIYTENKNYDAVISAVKTACFNGFTVIKAEGHFDDEKEHALIIDIVADDYQAVESVAYTIKKMNKQKEVLVVTVPCTVKTI